MAKLVVVIHAFDIFRVWVRPLRKIASPYLLFDVVKQLETMGHTVEIARGPELVEGDAALLHVDSTIVEQTYLDLAPNYRRTINFGTGDISKRATSRLLLGKGDSWDGQVIVKSNLNNGATMEDHHNHEAAKTGLPPPHPGVTKLESYRVLDSLAEVEDTVWSDPRLVVERFLPEPDEGGGYVLRTWVFMGSRERCTRVVTPNQVSKAGAIVSFGPCEVPDALRRERERLGFDFGKFDFVIHKGEPVLLDANRTPGIAQRLQPQMEQGARNLAEGLNELLAGL
jgi:hypothetical protein